MAETQPMMLQELCYTAADFRLQMNSIVCDEGVADLNDGSLLVTTGGSGLNVSVAEGAAFINSDAADQGMYSIYNDAPVTLTATAAHLTLPRIDQIIATVNDSQISGTDDNWVLSILPGTATGGANLTNLTGAMALPDRSIRLAYLLVDAAEVGPFIAGDILDARNPWVTCSEVPFVSLDAAATTSLTNGSFVQPTLATIRHIDRAYFSISGPTVTVLQDGWYTFEGWASATGMGTGGTARAGNIYRNNTNLPNASPDGIQIGNDNYGAVASAFFNPSRVAFPLSANDTIKFAVLQNSGGAINTTHAPATSAVSNLTVRKVG